MERFKVKYKTKNGEKIEDIDAHNICSAGIVFSGKLATQLKEDGITSFKIQQQLDCPYCQKQMPCIGSYPEGCFHPNKSEGDVIYNNTVTKLDFIDRIKVLIHGEVCVNSEIKTAETVNILESKSKPMVKPIFRFKRKSKGFTENSINNLTPPTV